MSSGFSRALCVVTKNPWRDPVKTRLARSIGVQKAQAVAVALLQCVLEELRRLSQMPQPDHAGSPQPISIYFALPSLPPSAPLLELLTSKEPRDLQIKLIQQRPGDLGEKLKGVFKDLFELSYSEVAVIGSDSPLFTAEMMTEGFERLSEAPWTIAPATDGGFAFLAARALQPPAFEGVRWSTPHTLQDLVDAQDQGRCLQNSKAFYYLKEVSDIDTLEDLLKVQAELIQKGRFTPKHAALAAFDS